MSIISKGAIFGGIIGFVLWFTQLMIPLPFPLSSPLCAVISNGAAQGWCTIVYGHISNIIIYGIIGALIGLIIQKTSK